jgi:RNA polymerase sigma-70 factor (ECF subfamily)
MSGRPGASLGIPGGSTGTSARKPARTASSKYPADVQDAEDALQDTLLAAWQGLGGFEGRASIRTWLYRIATNRCLNALRVAGRRPATQWDTSGVVPTEPTRLGEVVWLEPFPDALLEGTVDVPLGPEARYEQTEPSPWPS